MASAANSSDQLGELDQATRAAIGPRRVGGIYRNGYLDCQYRVEEVLTGEAAWAVIPFSEYVLVEVDLTGPRAGRSRVHCTAWDSRRDEIVEMPEHPGAEGTEPAP